MLVICDTNIWYGLADGTIPESEIKKENNYIVTSVSLVELSYTFTLVNNEQLVRNAIRNAINYHSHERFEPPPIYLKILSDPEFIYNTSEKQNHFMEFTSFIANGHSICDKKGFENFCRDRKKELTNMSDFFNSKADKIRKSLKDKSKHRSIDARPINRGLINLFVKSMTLDEGLSKYFDWMKIELFENVFMHYLINLETGAKKSVPNDWNDLFQLIYVQPGETYWTRDAKILRLINEG